LYLEHDGQLLPQGKAQTFTVKAVPTLPAGTDVETVATFQQNTSDLLREVNAASRQLEEAGERLRYLQEALRQTPGATAEHFAQLSELQKTRALLRIALSGDPARQRLNEASSPSIRGRLGQIAYGHWSTRQLPTQTFIDQLTIAQRDFADFAPQLHTYLKHLADFERSMRQAGAPYTPGQRY
jgi:hypothetical protein